MNGIFMKMNLLCLSHRKCLSGRKVRVDGL